MSSTFLLILVLSFVLKIYGYNQYICSSSISDCAANNTFTRKKDACPKGFCVFKSGVYQCSPQRLPKSVSSGNYALDPSECMTQRVDNDSYCLGINENEPCNFTGECSASMYCHKLKKVCTIGAGLNESCNATTLCKTHLFCYSGLCYLNGFYEDGTAMRFERDYLRCKSGFLDKFMNCTSFTQRLGDEVIDKLDTCFYEGYLHVNDELFDIYRADGKRVCKDFEDSSKSFFNYFLLESECTVGDYKCNLMKKKYPQQYMKAFIPSNYKNYYSKDFFDCNDETRFLYNLTIVDSLGINLYSQFSSLFLLIALIIIL